MNWKVSKNDSEDLGFALSCLIGGIVTWDEFLHWAERVIAEQADVPSAFFGIFECPDKFGLTLRAREVFGFTPVSGLSPRQERALDGIGYSRFPAFKSDMSKRNSGLSALEAEPSVRAQFNRCFPGLLECA